MSEPRAATGQAGSGHLDLRDVLTGETHRVLPRRLVVAGFTGRDPQAVQRHIEELREFGAVVPEKVPVFMVLDPSLVTSATRIEVTEPFTSGEVEPVVVVTDRGWLLAAGSDHTDRELERSSLLRSKQACPKVVGPTCVPLAAVPDLDAATLASWVDSDDTPYQRGALADILPLPEIVRLAAAEGVELAAGDVLFMGTVPVTGGPLRPAGRFRAHVRVPEPEARLDLDYAIHVGAP